MITLEAFGSRGPDVQINVSLFIMLIILFDFVLFAAKGDEIDEGNQGGIDREESVITQKCPKGQTWRNGKCRRKGVMKNLSSQFVR